MNLRKCAALHKDNLRPEFGLPLFTWADTNQLSPSINLSSPAAKLARRFGLSPLQASVVFELAGFKPLEILA